MVNRTREWRLRQDERIRARRLRYYAIAYAVEDGDRRRMGIFVRTPARCSCEMCGNPRRHFGRVTRQELAADLRRVEEE